MNRLRSECMHCLLKKIEDIPESASEPKKLECMQRILKILADAPLTISAPVLVRDINRIKKEMFGVENEYSQLKRHFNAFMLSYEEQIRKAIHASSDPLKAAIQYAMTGNYIDFGAMEHVDETYLSGLLSESRNIRIDPSQYERLCTDLQAAESLLLLCDNCGEIVMDKLLLEVIRRLYPRISITVMVRGEPVLNDATMEDAEQVGITKLFRVIGNGTGIAGTFLNELSAEAFDAVENAQIILSKGQGNFETLRKCGRNIYYLFLCKCEMFARQFHAAKFDGILIHDSCCQE